MRFSQRQGYTSAQQAIQIEGMDMALRTAIWNVVFRSYLSERQDIQKYNLLSSVKKVMIVIWADLYHQELDKFPYAPTFCDFLKNKINGGEWFIVYDLIEALASCGVNATFFTNEINRKLETHNAGYRVIEGVVTPITSEVELEAVTAALNVPDKYSGARAHIDTALQMLSDKTAPDYRNSIKESISAVESVVKILVGTSGAETLGQLLGKMEREHGLHKALKGGFSAIYGWTSDEGGIRHGMMDEPNVTLADARFMLIACSAFVNYLIETLGANRA